MTIDHKDRVKLEDNY